MRAAHLREQSLKSAVTIVTGATSGIGRATCLALSEAGSAIVPVGRKHGALESLAASIAEAGGEALPLCLDVRAEGDMEEMARRTLERFGRIDALVASAGVLRGGRPRLVAEMPVAEWDFVVETNLKGVFLSNRAVVGAMMRQRRGVIVNLSSTSGQRGLAYDSAYCASKFGVMGFSEALAEEVRGHGVKVQVVCPGPVETPVWQQNAPLPRPPDLLSSERVADLILYLLALPDDTALNCVMVVPFITAPRPAWRAAVGS